MFDKWKRKIVKRNHNKLNLLAQLEMEVTIETPILTGTYKEPILVASTNDASPMAIEFNVKNMNNDVEKEQTNINLLEDQILEA